MSDKRLLKINNKSRKPDNLVLKENDVAVRCKTIESVLPPYLSDFFIFLKNSVSINTRLAYLLDIRFFLNYLIRETDLTEAYHLKDISLAELDNLKARDINYYIGEYCTRYIIEGQRNSLLMENHNRSLSRKKSSLSVMFKFLYRSEMISGNIVDGFNPIKLPNKTPDSIKRLQIDEVAVMIDSVRDGKGLTEKERQYWEKTKLRDRAILMLFLTYGLRLSELEGLNISSFNRSRGEFIIFRKRGKEVLMPLNNSVEVCVYDYIETERKKVAVKSDGSDEDALFLSIQGRRMNQKSIRELVKKYTSIPLGTARRDGYSPHKLRATAASSLIENGFSIYDVQNLLDHDNVTTTQLYSAHRKNVKRDIVKNFELLDEDDTVQGMMENAYEDN